MPVSFDSTLLPPPSPAVDSPDSMRRGWRSERALACGTIQAAIGTEDLVDEADVVACLLKADHFQQKIRVGACQVAPGDGIPGTRIVGRERRIPVPIQQVSVPAQV